MISFNYEVDFKLNNEELLSIWIKNALVKEGFKLGEINYVFCDDAYLHKLNVEFLAHDTYTDIISFDYTVGKLVQGDIFISIDRVDENSKLFNASFEDELNRVMIHGVLHYCGYKDKSETQKAEMRSRENYFLELLHKK